MSRNLTDSNPTKCFPRLEWQTAQRRQASCDPCEGIPVFNRQWTMERASLQERRHMSHASRMCHMCTIWNGRHRALRCQASWPAPASPLPSSTFRNCDHVVCSRPGGTSLISSSKVTLPKTGWHRCSRKSPRHSPRGSETSCPILTSCPQTSGAGSISGIRSRRSARLQPVTTTSGATRLESETTKASFTCRASGQSATAHKNSLQVSSWKPVQNFELEESQGACNVDK